MPWTLGFEYRYTYYHYRLRDTHDPHGSLLESYYHYIKWLKTKNKTFTATDILYQLKVMNDYFIKSSDLRKNEDLTQYNKKDLWTLDTHIETHLKNRPEYIQSKENWSRLKLFLTFAVGVTLFVLSLHVIPIAAVGLPMMSIGGAMLFYPLFNVCFSDVMKPRQDSPYTANVDSKYIPSFNIGWGLLSVATLALSALRYINPIGFLASDFMVIPLIALMPLTWLGCHSFVKTPIKGVEKIPAAQNPDEELKTQITHFCHLERPSPELKTAVNATTTCLLHGFQRSYDRPTIEMAELEEECKQRFAFQAPS